MATRSSQKTTKAGTSGAFRRCFGMATHGNNRFNGKDRPVIGQDEPHRSNGSFPGTGSDQWHRTLTGRQSPEPVSAKLRMIYGNIVAEQLPADMLDLLAKLDHESPEQ